MGRGSGAAAGDGAGKRARTPHAPPAQPTHMWVSTTVPGRMLPERSRFCWSCRQYNRAVHHGGGGGERGRASSSTARTHTYADKKRMHTRVRACLGEGEEAGVVALLHDDEGDGGGVCSRGGGQGGGGRGVGEGRGGSASGAHQHAHTLARCAHTPSWGRPSPGRPRAARCTRSEGGGRGMGGRASRQAPRASAAPHEAHPQFTPSPPPPSL